MSDLLRGVNLFLIGMMGSGKSTVGRLIADRLSYRFFDTDAIVEQAAHQPITQIFETSGEAAFRQLETQVLAELSTYSRLVVATGGGIVLARQNWSYLHHGLIVWLDAAPELLYARLQGDSSRPLLNDADPLGRLQSILEQRQVLYAQADLHLPIAAGETPEQVVDRLLEQIPTVLKPEAQPEHELS